MFFFFSYIKSHFTCERTKNEQEEQSMEASIQGTLQHFVTLHAERIRKVETGERVAFLADATSSLSLPLSVKLVPFTREDIVSKLNVEAQSVRWLLRQVDTYVEAAERVLGLLVPGGEAFAHVIRFGAQKQSGDGEDDDDA